ncbi:ARPP-2 domain-containing protein [Catenulispora subtropica]|uniref:ARG and Rhodanese-Phosphatase-superfamily-associated domain-containing protein n=1 Tax=Catenulispora subtropica TaxID=450798 RepID=A0ABN2SHB8_9ACTN
MRIDLSGLRTGPAQVWGALRLVPLLRDEPVESLRLHGVAYEGAWRSQVKLTNTTSYYSYVPHGFVADWNPESGDGAQSAAYGTQIVDKSTTVRGMPMPVHRRMAQKLGKRRVRFLPLHLAMEGYLALHFDGPPVAWREWSDRFVQHGLSPRSEASYNGAAVPGLRDALRVFEIHEGQSGVLVYAADALAAAFVVPHPDDYRELHPTLVLDMYGELVYQYALMMPAVRDFHTRLEDDTIISLADLRAAARAQSRSWAEFHDTVMANALLSHDYTAERAYQMGDFDLVRFRPAFKPGDENHIGEAITDGAGRIAYLKTFRLSEAQIRRGYLLELLASNGWRLSAAAASIGTTAEDLRGRIRAAGFEMMLREKAK